MKILAGDIGGTKTTLGIFEIDSTDLISLVEKEYSSSKYNSLREIIDDFLKRINYKVKWASFGVAGPIRNSVVKTTNLPWVIDAEQLANEMGFHKVWLINDLEANAWGISTLKEKDFFTLNSGKADPYGNSSIISAGTGLGQAGLFFNTKELIPFASEGGHSDFSPKSDIEIDLLKYLSERYEHVSWETILSGRGLENIYDFLCDRYNLKTEQWLLKEISLGDKASSISKNANKSCPICLEALNIFLSLYGAEAGNHALKIMATAGVYIGGGIAPKNIDSFKNSNFMNSFNSKGRMRHIMVDIPVRIILNERTALYGAVVFAGREIVCYNFT